MKNTIDKLTKKLSKALDYAYPVRPIESTHEAYMVLDALSYKFSAIEVHMKNGSVHIVIIELFKDGSLKARHNGYAKTLCEAVCAAAMHAMNLTVSTKGATE